MTKSVKWLLGIISFIVITLLALVIIATKSINPNDYRDEISQAAQDHANIDLAIGDIQWSFFPWLGLDVSQTTIAATTGDPLAEVDNIKLSVKVLPLLSGQVQIGKVALVGGHIHVVQQADGTLNWDALSQTTSDTDSPESTAKETGTNLDLSVGKILIQDAQLSYKNLADATALTIDEINVEANNVHVSSKQPTSKFPVHIGFRFKDNAGLSSTQNISAIIHLNIDAMQMAVNDLAIVSQTKMPGISNDIKTRINANITLSTLAQTLAVQGLNVSLNETTILTGELTMNQLDTDPQFNGQFKIPKTPIRPIAKHFAVELPETASDKALSHVFGSLAISGNTHYIDIKPIELTVDESTLTGFFTIEDLSTQAIRSELLLDQVVLDHYLPPATDQSATADASANTTPESTAAESTATLIPIETIQSLNMHIDLRISKLVSNDLEVDDTHIMMIGNNGKLSMDPIEGKTLGGRFKLSAQIDVNSTEPTLSIHKDLNHIQIEPAIDAFADNSALAGLLFFGGDLQTSGNTIPAWKNNLTGNSQLKLTEGLLKGVNLTELAYEQLGQLGPLVKTYLETDNPINLPPAFKKDSQIKEVLADVQFNQGVASTQQLKLSLDDAQANGSAAYDMINEKLTFTLNLRLNESISNPYVANIEWPMHCEGSLNAAPNCTVSLKPVKQHLEKLAKQAAKSKVNQAIADKLKEKTGLDIAPNQLKSSVKAEANQIKDSEKEALKRQLEDSKEKAASELDNQLKERLKGLF